MPHLVCVVLVSGGLVTLIWCSAIMILRRINFLRPPENGRRIPAPPEEEDHPEIRSRVIEYHDKAIYQAFEFFFKITLALVGGIAYVALATDQDASVAATLVRAGGYLHFASGLVFSIIVFLHQKSKIQRWPRCYLWYQPFFWAEFWLIMTMICVPSVVVWSLLPAIRQALG